MKLLICDDEDDILMMLQRFLSAKGYDLLLAKNGEEALKQAQHQPDLILLDIAMPPPDGLEVCRRIRRFLDCPILFLSARISENDKVKGFASGGDAYIIKPFSLIELEARIATHLRRQHRALDRGHIKFAHDLSIDYQRHAVYYKEEKINFAKKNLRLLPFYHKMLVKFLIKSVFTKRFGAMTATETVVSLLNIFTESAPNSALLTITLILKQFGAVDTNG